MIERVMLYESIVNEIKKYISDNNLKPGDRLPNQEAFTKMLGVSRTSLREALRTLQAIHLIEVINGKGIYVKEKDNYKIEATVNVEDEKQSLLYILEVRTGIEGLAVRLAAERATPEDIARMEESIEKIKEKAARGECHPNEDKEFHNAIYIAAKNPILIEMMQNLYEVIDKLWQNPLGVGKAFNEVANLHAELLEHIKAKSPKKAENTFIKLMHEEELIIKNI